MSEIPDGKRDWNAHELVDRAFARSMRRSMRLYAEGFGDPARLATLVEGVASMGPEPSDPVELRWGGSRRWLGTRVRTGRFASTASLPPEVSTGHVEEWMPRPGAPVCLVLATTAEEGPRTRRGTALFLAHHGIGSLILENPFYGLRRPRGQRGASLRTVADQFAMNLATVIEACALLRTYHERGHAVGVTGYSQGGFMAAFATALSPFPVASVPRGAARSAEPIFVSHALTKTMRWDVLAKEAGSLDVARARFSEALQSVRLDHLPKPAHPASAILVSARNDAFIPADEAEALHTLWAGSELRWLRGGHVTGLVLEHHVHRRALLDAFASLPR